MVDRVIEWTSDWAFGMAYPSLFKAAARDARDEMVRLTGQIGART